MYNHNANDPDIFLSSACFNSNFIRNFNQLCEAENIQKPIFIGESEFGQYAFGEESDFNDVFYDNLFRNGLATIGNAITADNLNENSNPTVIIPDKENRPMQLSIWQKVKKFFQS